MGHFGGTAQPFAREAKEWLTGAIQGRRCTVTLHRLDQYNRVIGSVWYWPGGLWWYLCQTFLFWWPPRNLSLDMVRAGYATVYESSGAEYGGLRKQLVQAESRARTARVGMWCDGEAGFVPPSVYKKQRIVMAASTALSHATGIRLSSSHKDGIKGNST